MRVLYSYPDTVGKPGIGWVALHQVKGLVELGVELDLHCTSVLPDVRLDGVRRLVKTLELRGRRIPHRALGIGRAYRYHDLRVARALESARGGYDLVHVWPRAVVRTAGVARRLGIPVLREVPNTHTAHAFEVVAREHERLGLPLAKGQTHGGETSILALEEEEYRAADLLLVPSELAERTFLERGFDRAQLAVHRYGYDKVRFTPGAEPSPAAPLQVLFAARCEPRKGLHHALRAWHDSGVAERGRLVVCGEWVGEYRALLEPLLDHPSIDWRGFVPNLDEVMRESQVFLLPSVEEGSALVTYAAQGCGCVPVVSDAAGARCRHMEDGLVHEAGDVETLAAHLRLLDEDRELLARLRRGTLATAQTLGWDDAGAELLAIYRRVVA